MRPLLKDIGLLLLSFWVTQTGAWATTGSKGEAARIGSYLHDRLSRVEGADPRVLARLRVQGGCKVGECRSEERTGSGLPPMHLVSIRCDLAFAFDRELLQGSHFTDDGRGRSCEVARRDAPMQMGERLLPAVREKILEESRKIRLEEMTEMLQQLEVGAGRLSGLAPEKHLDNVFKQIDRALDASEVHGRSGAR